MQAIATWRGGYETLLEDDRAHSLTVDLPVDEGGHSQGPAPIDLAFLALAGSIATTLVQAADRRHVPLYGLAVAIEAERPTPSGPIARVRGTARLRLRSDGTEVADLLSAALAACPVARLFAAAGVPIDVEPILVPTSPPGPLTSGRHPGP